MPKQTSIEWLEHKLNSVKPTDFCSIETIKEWLIEAKQMHNEEIVKAWNDGDYAYFYSKETGRDFEDGNEYYQETYGGNK